MISVKLTIFVVLCFELARAGVLQPIVPLKRPLWLMAWSNIELSCPFTGSPDIEWLKDHMKIESNNPRATTDYSSERKTSKLTIKDTVAADAGTYTCRLTSGAEQQQVIVKFLQVSVTNARYKSGKSAMLSVTTENLSPADRESMVITWLKNGTERIISDATHAIDKVNNSLTLTSPTRRDIGKYVSEFSFEVTENNKKVQTILAQPVSLFAKPHIKASYRSKNLVEGDILMLECEATGYPIPNITWYRGTDMLVTANRTIIGDLVKEDQYGSVYVHNGKLVVKELTFADRADYMCEAFNQYGSYNYTVTLRVKDKLAALWPFLAIVCEVVILCVIIFIYEKKKGKELDAASAHLNGKHVEYGDIPRDKKPSKEDVRLRKS